MPSSMINLYTLDNASGVLAIAYAHTMARKLDACLTVMPIPPSFFAESLGTSNIAIRTARNYPIPLMQNHLWVHGLTIDSTVLGRLCEIRMTDPYIQIAELQVNAPRALLLTLEAMLRIFDHEDIILGCAMTPCEEIRVHELAYDVG